MRFSLTITLLTRIQIASALWTTVKICHYLPPTSVLFSFKSSSVHIYTWFSGSDCFSSEHIYGLYFGLYLDSDWIGLRTQLLSIVVNCCQLLSIVSDLSKVYVFYYCKLPQLTLPMIPPDCPSFRSVQLHRRLPEPLLFTIFCLVFILLESSTYKSFYKYSFNFASIVSGPYTPSFGLSYNGSNLS